MQAGHYNLCAKCYSHITYRYSLSLRRKLNRYVDALHEGYSTTVSDESSRLRTMMSAWHLHSYGGNEEMTLAHNTRIPTIHKPQDILVEVFAASVNPVDVKMRGGYGRNMINILRRNNKGLSPLSEFPLTLGRDFSGVVVDIGRDVKKFKPGDEVWGAVAVQKQGTHAEYVVSSENEISLKPESLLHAEAASFPYVIATSWQALCAIGNLNEKNTPEQRVLIIGGSGGIGTFAIQLMKAWGAEVTVTCTEDAANLVTSLGADVVIDYKSGNMHEELKRIEGFDFVYDAIGLDTNLALSLLKTWRISKYVTLKTPVMENTDRLGIPLGIAVSGGNLGCNLFKALTNGQVFGWSFFRPSVKALETVAALIDSAQITPVIDKVFPFVETLSAYDKVAEGHARGKTVISMKQ